MGLSFLNGAFLAGLSLVAVPILLHLLQRRRFRVVRWGAMEFLRVSQRNRSRRLMIEQLLLLFLRCLIVALVVLAICRPVLRPERLPFAGGAARGPVHAILIVDNSYSMGYRPPGAQDETLFERARRRALELVERGLQQGDGVSVVLASEPPRALIRKPSLDLEAAADLLRRSLRLSDAGTNYGRAARLALEIAGESRFVNREVYLISDQQEVGWRERRADPQAWEALGKLARVVMLPVREGPAPNAAVEWVEAARGLATVRSTTRIQARIVNRSPRPLRNLMVRLEIDGQPQGPAQRVDLEPNGAALVAFHQVFDEPGVHACAVRLSGDRLPEDDVGYLALRVRQSVKVLVLNGAPNPGTPQRDAGFFLRLALAPPPAGGAQAGPGGAPADTQPLEPRTLEGATFGNTNLRDYDIVALSNVAALGEADRRLLAEFVQNGGGALVFLGDRVDPALYNRDLFDGRPSLLPARLQRVAEGKTALDPATLDHPALQRFRGAEDVSLHTAEFRRYFQLAARPDDRAVRVMARFTNGAPALVEKQFGLGRVVLIASSATTDWNTLPLKPAFLPLLHQIVAYLATGADGTRNGRVGEPLVKPLPLAEAGRRVTLRDPAGGTLTVKPVVDDRGALVTLEKPQRAGFYRLAVEGGTRDLFAVNRDTAESDLKALDEAALRRLLPVPGLVWIRLNEDLVSALQQSRTGIELWRALLFAALALMLIETMLAQRFGRRA